MRLNAQRPQGREAWGELRVEQLEDAFRPAQVAEEMLAEILHLYLRGQCICDETAG